MYVCTHNPVIFIRVKSTCIADVEHENVNTVLYSRFNTHPDQQHMYMHVQLIKVALIGRLEHTIEKLGIGLGNEADTILLHLTPKFSPIRIYMCPMVKGLLSPKIGAAIISISCGS